jgi:SAM-dependent methyltransferase
MICPFCGSRETHPIKRYSSPGGYPFQCDACDVIFFKPFRAGPIQFYNSTYYKPRSDAEILDTQKPNVWSRIILSELKRLSTGRVILDVGCGYGGFLIEAKKEGFRVTGVDFSRTVVNFVRRQGISDVFVDDIYSYLLKEKRAFDAITAIHVLEHLDAPRKFIKLINNRLKKDGILCISVPFRDRFLAGYGTEDVPPNHISHWNETSLTNFLENNGFKVSEIKTFPLYYDKAYLGAAFFDFFFSNLKKKIKATFFNYPSEGSVSNTSFECRKNFFSNLQLLGKLFFEYVTLPLALILSLGGYKGMQLIVFAKKKQQTLNPFKIKA